MRAAKSLRRSAWKWAVAVFAVLIAAVMRGPIICRCRRRNRRTSTGLFDLGVLFLKKAQLRNGTWVAEGNNSVGYAALPGLTLLECGVATDDPAIKKRPPSSAAPLSPRSIRRSAPTTWRLTILFLDKLGDPRDEPLIRSMALRLVAGQSPTGGWGYKCPVLPPQERMNSSPYLHHIAPGPSPIPLEGEAVLAGFPAGGGKLAGQPAVNPGVLAGGPAVNGPGLAGTAIGDPSLLGGAATKSPGETTPSPGAALNLSTNPTTADKGMLALQGREESIGSRHWAWCIKSEEDAPDGPSDPSKGKPKPPPAPFVLPKPLFIPPDLRQFSVLQDFSKIELLDPKDKGEALVYATTDNSNTQFAILALWVAQRHDVPMERTLRLVTTRFQSSQSADGSWNYRYTFGGGEAEGPAMDCVGLLGLAVGHGIAQAGQGGVNAGPDPAILSGFAALSRHVGVPAGRTHDLPLANMYLLWSIERVAVLYGLPTIANKDWYRWGAEILVSNQALAGNWPADGGYPGQTPMANTCLALLFLRKANLVSDLTAALPFQAEDLTKSIEDKVAPKASTPPAAPTPPADPPAPPTGLEGKPAQPIAPAGAGPAAPANLSGAQTPAAPTRTDAENSGGGQGWFLLVLVLIALVLLAASGTVFFLHLRNRNQTAKVSRKGRSPKAAEKHAAGAASAGKGVKKHSGKTRLRA